MSSGIYLFKHHGQTALDVCQSCSWFGQCSDPSLRLFDGDCNTAEGPVIGHLKMSSDDHICGDSLGDSEYYALYIYIYMCVCMYLYLYICIYIHVCNIH